MKNKNKRFRNSMNNLSERLEVSKKSLKTKIQLLRSKEKLYWPNVKIFRNNFMMQNQNM